MSRTKQKSARPSSNSEMLFARLGPITYRRPEELTAYARNARKHPERQVVSLAASIREFGFNMPVLIDGKGEIIAGHARNEAAKRVGLAEVPTISATHLSPAQVKAYRLADNRLGEQSTWDLDALAVEFQEIIALDEIEVESMGWSTAEMDALLVSAEPDASDGSDPADMMAEPPANPIVRTGDLWLLDHHRLLCASALEVSSWQRLMGDQIARMAFTSSPHGAFIPLLTCEPGEVRRQELRETSERVNTDGFAARLAEYLHAMIPYVVDGGIMYLCGDWSYLREFFAVVDTASLSVLDLCVWSKKKGVADNLYQSNHEMVLVIKKGVAPHIINSEIGKPGRYRTNVWDYALVSSSDAGHMLDLTGRSTAKPIALVADAIRDVSLGGEIVIDGSMGLGTTLLAAERTGRVGYGIEIEPRYMDVAIRRWQEMTGRTAVLDGDGRTWAEIAAERRAAAENDTNMIINTQEVTRVAA